MVDHLRYETYLAWFMNKFIINPIEIKEDPNYEFWVNGNVYNPLKHIRNAPYSGGSTMGNPIYSTNTYFNPFI